MVLSNDKGHTAGNVSSCTELTTLQEVALQLRGETGRAEGGESRGCMVEKVASDLGG